MPTVTQIAGYPQWDVDAMSGGAVVTMKVIVPWSDVITYADSLMPKVTITGTGLQLVLGATWDANPAYRVRNFTIRPLFSGEAPKTTTSSSLYGYSTTPDYDYAEFEIQYEYPGWGTDSDQGDDPIPYLRHSWSTGLEHIAVPSARYYWEDSSGKVRVKQQSVSQGIVAMHTTHRIEWPLLLNPPFDIIRDTIGHVNNTTFNFKTGTAPAEALLFMGADIDQRILGDGTIAFKMVYIFEEALGRTDEVTGADAGWNHFWRDDQDASGWYRVWRRTNSGYQRVYPTADFNPLFGL